MKRKNSRKSGKRNRSAAKPSAAVAPISLSMIVKNEERYLEDCLRSVSGLVSEIVIVDTGSTDKTMDIARRFTDKLYYFEWCDDFAAARNKALEKTTQPWVLYLDADERLHPQYHPLVREAVASARADAYYLKVCSEVNGILGDVPHIMAYPRLFRKQPGVEFEGRIHEQITPSIRRIGGNFAPLDVEIEHLGYHVSEEELREKIRRNLLSLQRQVEDEPENAYAKFQLGQTYILSGEPEKGEQCLRLAFEAQTLSKALNASILLILANERFKAERFGEAINLIRDALKLAPRQRLGWFMMSDCFGRQERYAEALHCLEEYRKFHKLPFTDLAIDKFFSEYFIDQRLALYRFFLKDYDEAINYFNRYWSQGDRFKTSSLQRYIYALMTSSHSVVCYQKVLNNLIRHLDRFDDVASAFNMLATHLNENREWEWLNKLIIRMLELEPENPAYAFLQGNTLLQQQRFDAAEAAFTRALNLAADTFEIYHNLAITAIKQGDYSKAIRRYQHILEKFPEKAELAVRRMSALYLKLGQVEEAQRVLCGLAETQEIAG